MRGFAHRFSVRHYQLGGEPPDDGLNASDEEAERRIRDEFEQLLPSNSNQLGLSESLDMVVKISSYEGALNKVLTRLFNMLLGLQDMGSKSEKT
jgi:hypothetical protein